MESKKGAKIKKNINVQSHCTLLPMPSYRPLLAMWFRRVILYFSSIVWGSLIQFEYFNKFVQTVKITVIVLFNDVVNFAPKFALNYLHFAFFAYKNLVHILLHHKICLCNFPHLSATFRTLPHPSAPFRTLPHLSATFRNIPQHFTTFRNILGDVWECSGMFTSSRFYNPLLPAL